MHDQTGFTLEETIVISWQWKHNELNNRILDLAKTLDSENLEKLAKGFPHHVSALTRFYREEGWFRSIEDRVLIGQQHTRKDGYESE